MRDLKDQIENLRHELELSRDAISVADRKASAASHDAEEARTLLATSERYTDYMKSIIIGPLL